MSAVIKTTTPFTLELALFNALQVLGSDPIRVGADNLKEYHQRGQLIVGDILTNRCDYNGKQHFRCIEGLWVLRHDSDELNARVFTAAKTSRQYNKVGAFLQELEGEYARQYEFHLEQLAVQEKQRLEAERKARVEVTRQSAITQAKAKGYVVQEKHLNGKIQLVCTRSV